VPGQYLPHMERRGRLRVRHPPPRQRRPGHPVAPQARQAPPSHRLPHCTPPFPSSAHASLPTGCPSEESSSGCLTVIQMLVRLTALDSASVSSMSGPCVQRGPAWCNAGGRHGLFRDQHSEHGGALRAGPVCGCSQQLHRPRHRRAQRAAQQQRPHL
jgi:hypothetical protein